MTEQEIRRSSRSNKGTNKYLRDQRIAELEYVKARARAQKSDGESFESVDTVRCLVCGTTDDNYDEADDPHGDMIQCDKCNTWQHIKCMFGKDEVNDLDEYFCSICSPASYPDIVYAIDPSSLNKTSLAHGREYSHNHQNYEDDEEEHILDSGTEDEHQLPTKRRKKSKLKTDHNVATSSPEAKLRESARKMFEDLFLKYIIPDTIAAQRFQVPSETSIEELASTFAMELERELFAYNNTQDEAKSTDIYKEKVRVLFSNLKDQKNLQMKTLVVNKALPFSQLVRMSVNEIINPDLQNFRERVDSATLDQLIIEQPHKPQYFKTHKGEELIEDPNAYEPEDMIFSKNILASNHNSEAQVAEVGSEERVDTDPSLKSLEQQSKKLEPQEAHLDDLWRCSIEYKELHTTFSGNAQPIGYSQALSTKVLRDAFGDGMFEVEGRLKSEEAEKYILQMSSSRAFAVYAVMPRDSPAERGSFEQIHEFLQSRQRYGALKAKRQYVRHVYVIPWEEGHTSEVLKHVELSNPGTTLLNETCFLVVAILRTDMLDLT